jgi:hypothetical protein
MDLTPVIERLDRAVLLLEHIAATARTPSVVPAPSADEGLWNTKQVATYLKCSESKVYKAAEAGDCRAYATAAPCASSLRRSAPTSAAERGGSPR